MLGTKSRISDDTRMKMVGMLQDIVNKNQSPYRMQFVTGIYGLLIGVQHVDEFPVVAFAMQGIGNAAIEGDPELAAEAEKVMKILKNAPELQEQPPQQEQPKVPFIMGDPV